MQLNYEAEAVGVRAQVTSTAPTCLTACVRMAACVRRGECVRTEEMGGNGGNACAGRQAAAG